MLPQLVLGELGHLGLLGLGLKPIGKPEDLTLNHTHWSLKCAVKAMVDDEIDG